MKISFLLIYPRVLVASLVVIALLLLTGLGLPVAQSTPIVSEEEVVTAAFVDSGVVLLGVRYGNAQWGDCNNDLSPEVLITGEISTTARIAAVYQQDLLHVVFTKVADLTGVINGAAAWGDYNGDGWLDIALSGESSIGPITKIYRNTGNCTFSDIGASLVGVRYSSVAWGDYNNDGRPDLLVTGDNGTSPVTKIYRNVQGVFSDSGIQLPGVKNGTAVWGDYNNDGRLDILLTGASAQGALTKIFRNDGNGVFADIQAPLTALNRGAAAWGDYDRDGDLDILLTGTSAAPAAVAEIYRNNNGVFVKNTSAGLTGSNDTWTTAAWADYNHDGLLDALITTNGVPTVYRNLGTGVFTDTLAGLPFLNDGSAVWGDYDANRQPDILLTGLGPTGHTARIYGSADNIPNAAPSAPTGLTYKWTGSEIRFNWSAATDDITPTLTYNLRAGTQPGKFNIIAPLAITGVGYRLVPAMGNTFTSLTATVKNLPRGTYYWSVQAIDGAFVGSGFAPESKFVVPYEVYLPLVLKEHMTYFEGPWEMEPNDTYQMANGPLRSGIAYYGIHDDERDYYAVNLATPGTVNVDMTSSSAGTQIQLFYQVADVAHRIGYDPTPPYNLNNSGQAGWYYIMVFTDARYLGTQTYTLTVTYP